MCMHSVRLPSSPTHHTTCFSLLCHLLSQHCLCIGQAVPFLYELRALLDWTCTSTSLGWYAWLKLEDVRSGLFIEQCRCE